MREITSWNHEYRLLIHVLHGSRKVLQSRITKNKLLIRDSRKIKSTNHAYASRKYPCSTLRKPPNGFEVMKATGNASVVKGLSCYCDSFGYELHIVLSGRGIVPLVSSILLKRSEPFVWEVAIFRLFYMNRVNPDESVLNSFKVVFTYRVFIICQASPTTLHETLESCFKPRC